jgi:hypothetical protein
MHRTRDVVHLVRLHGDAMTRRLPASKLIRRLPLNPANVERRLRRLKQEILALADGIDEALATLARPKDQPAE